MNTKTQSLIFLLFIFVFSNSNCVKIASSSKVKGTVGQDIADMILGFASAFLGGNSSQISKCLPKFMRPTSWKQDTFQKDSLTKFGETNKYLNIAITGFRVIARIACFLRKAWGLLTRIITKIGVKVGWIVFTQTRADTNGKWGGFFKKTFHKATNWAKKTVNSGKKKLVKVKSWAKKRVAAAGSKSASYKRKLLHAKVLIRKKATAAIKRLAVARTKLRKARSYVIRRAKSVKRKIKILAKKKLAKVKAIAFKARAKVIKLARVAKKRITRAKAYAKKLKQKALSLLRNNSGCARHVLRNVLHIAKSAARHVKRQIISYKNRLSKKINKATAAAIQVAKQQVRYSRKFLVAPKNLALRAYYRSRNQYLKAKNFAKATWSDIKLASKKTDNYMKKGWNYINNKISAVFKDIKPLIKRVLKYFTKAFSNISKFISPPRVTKTGVVFLQEESGTGVANKFTQVMQILSTCGQAVGIAAMNVVGIISTIISLGKGLVTPQTLVIGVICNLFYIIKLVDFIIDLVKGKPPSVYFHIGKVLGQFLFTVMRIIGEAKVSKKVLPKKRIKTKLLTKRNMNLPKGGVRLRAPKRFP